jgi:hypothetical protein
MPYSARNVREHKMISSAQKTDMVMTYGMLSSVFAWAPKGGGSTVRCWMIRQVQDDIR